MANTSVLEGLIQSLHRLPGVGVKSASRMAYYLLQHDREGAKLIADALQKAVAEVQHCELCNTFTTQPVCLTCADTTRDSSRLCVVESPADQSAVERTAAYKGLYFVLMGRISPLDDQGPKDIGLQKLLERASDGVVSEVILATNYTVEGEATAHYISELLSKHGLKITRIARGMPMGGEIEYVDAGTLAQAMMERRNV